MFFHITMARKFLLHLDLLSRDKFTGIPNKYFVCLHKVFKRSSRHVFKTSSRHVFKTSSRRLQDQLMFAGWVLNTPLILSSNFIWHTYRLIAETKIFRLVVSLICFLYAKEVWIGKKVDYRKI